MGCDTPDENVTIGIEVPSSESEKGVQIPCSTSKSNMKRIYQEQFVHPDVLRQIRPPDECKYMKHCV